MHRTLSPYLAALLALTLGSACAANQPEADYHNPPPAGVDEPTPRVKVFDKETGSEFLVWVEIADNPIERRNGLMFRTELPDDNGMFFVFATEQQQSFWMKNTLIPLDMVFINEALEVVGVVHDAEPETLTPRSVPGVSKYVLEVNAGWCAHRGIERGDRVEVFDVNLVVDR